MRLTGLKSAINSFLRPVFLVGLLYVPTINWAQSQAKKVLFIGNSYTYYNNLPQLTADVASTTGDTLIVDDITQGGARLLTHAANPAVYAKMKADDWTYVVLQAQSQEPSWPIQQVQTEVFPYAAQLSDSIHALNTCAIPVFFMTWGRKNGDQQNCPNWPPVCTYEGMDSLLNERYQTMGTDNQGLVSPVGAVWNYIRSNYPNIDLYTTDGSHPSPEGSYAAAVTFYTLFLQKDPTLTSVVGGIDPNVAALIQTAAKMVVYDDLGQWNVLAYNATADFTYTQSGDTAQFTNASGQWNTLLWDFGDGNTATVENPQHIYAGPGNYTVALTAQGCYNVADTAQQLSVINSVGQVHQQALKAWPNPVVNQLNLATNSSLSGAVYWVFDMTGKEVLTGQIHTTQIALGTLSPGMYMMHITTTEKEVFSFQVSKK